MGDAATPPVTVGERQGEALARADGARDAGLDEFFASYYRLRPVNATFTGVRGHDHRLPDWSAAGNEAALGEMRSLRRALQGSVALGADVVRSRDWPAIDRHLADGFLEIQIAELEGRGFQRGNPSLAIGEAIFAVLSLVITDGAPIGERVRAATQRLHALPDFLDGATDVLLESPIPWRWTQRALVECEGARAFLSDGIVRWLAQDGVRDPSREGALRAAHVALGAVHRFAGALAASTRGDTQVRACGEEVLQRLVRRGHGCERSPDELLREARAQFPDERVRLEAMARALDSLGLAGVQEQLAAQHPSRDSYYQAFHETWRACRALSEVHQLVTWPDAPIRYVPIPEWTRQAAPSLYYLYYRSPAPFRGGDVHTYVVPATQGMDDEALARHLRAWNDSVIKLNHVVHHGALGHHVQNWYAARSPSRIGQIAAVDCASRIGMFLGGTMAEGWACYATDLMDEAGFLTPEERVSEQQTRVRMLARAIVDLELHTGQRSFDDAVRLYIEDVGMTESAATGETVKNSMFPGTALMYWLGTSSIHDLRSDMERQLGTAFTRREFHDELLSFGSIPVAVSAALMRARAGAA